MRQAQVTRKTGETDITLTVNLDGTGRYDIRTGVGFFDHMLTGFARHGKFDLTVTCTGDTWVDDHHTVEDVGICLGQAFAQALGEMRGWSASARACCPWMRPSSWGRWTSPAGGCSAGTWPCPRPRWAPLTQSWPRSFGWPSPGKPAAPSTCGRWPGENSHHILEGVFKAAGRSLKQAVALTGTTTSPPRKEVSYDCSD